MPPPPSSPAGPLRRPSPDSDFPWSFIRAPGTVSWLFCPFTSLPVGPRGRDSLCNGLLGLLKQITTSWGLKQEKCIVSEFWRIKSKTQVSEGWFPRRLRRRVRSKPSPRPGGGCFLPASSLGLPSVCLCPNFLLLQGHQSDRTRAHVNGLSLT